MSIRSITFAAALAVLSSAHAAEITLVGSTKGYFNAGPTPTATATLGGLTFTGGSFSTQTQGNFYSIGDVFSGNLGTFSLSGTPFSYFGSTFTLEVNFTTPTGITPTSSPVYSASLLGRIVATPGGGVTVLFDQTPQSFSFAGGAGQFDLTVNPVSVGKNDVIAVSGYGTGEISTVPGPGAAAAMAIGLVGLRRRRRSA